MKNTTETKLRSRFGKRTMGNLMDFFKQQKRYTKKIMRKQKKTGASGGKPVESFNRLQQLRFQVYATNPAVNYSELLAEGFVMSGDGKSLGSDLDEASRSDGESDSVGKSGKSILKPRGSGVHGKRKGSSKSSSAEDGRGAGRSDMKRRKKSSSGQSRYEESRSMKKKKEVVEVGSSDDEKEKSDVNQGIDGGGEAGGISDGESGDDYSSKRNRRKPVSSNPDDLIAESDAKADCRNRNNRRFLAAMLGPGFGGFGASGLGGAGSGAGGQAIIGDEERQRKEKLAELKAASEAALKYLELGAITTEEAGEAYRKYIEFLDKS